MEKAPASKMGALLEDSTRDEVAGEGTKSVANFLMCVKERKVDRLEKVYFAPEAKALGVPVKKHEI